MMLPEVGVFARTFTRPTAREVATAVADAGFSLAQFNFSSIGLPTLAADVSADDVAAVGLAFTDQDVSIWGLSATYNVIHPDRESRTRNTRDAMRLIRLSPLLGVTAVTLCSGTMNTTDMWTGHPDNHSATAWAEMRATFDALLEAASDVGIKLGIEPEAANVVGSAKDAHRLINELGFDARHIGIVLDPGNLVEPEYIHGQNEVVNEAFDLLGDHVICLQAKDLTAAGPTPLGLGDLDYGLICRRVLGLARSVPIIIQDATEDDASRSGRYLRDRLLAARTS